MRTVIEFPEFIKKAEKVFSEDEREKIVFLLSKNPKAGDKPENFGGLRKLEWSRKGKSSAEYNIYFHPGNNDLPVVIISIFKKGEKLILNKIIEILIHSKINELR